MSACDMWKRMQSEAARAVAVRRCCVNMASSPKNEPASNVQNTRSPCPSLASPVIWMNPFWMKYMSRPNSPALNAQSERSSTCCVNGRCEKKV